MSFPIPTITSKRILKDDENACGDCMHFQRWDNEWPGGKFKSDGWCMLTGDEANFYDDQCSDFKEG
jgi:hypothetical protein